MASELDYLIGGRITAVTESPFEDDWITDPTLTLTVTFTKPKKVKSMGDTFFAKSVDMQVWMDEEGNGPGALVLVSAMEVVPV
jgi:hypothetical protein